MNIVVPNFKAKKDVLNVSKYIIYYCQTHLILKISVSNDFPKCPLNNPRCHKRHTSAMSSHSDISIDRVGKVAFLAFVGRCP